MKLDPKIARDGAENVEIEMRRSLPPVLKKMREDGYTIIALEQATHSKSLHEISFPPRKSVIVLGNERTGLKEDELACVDECVEIPVWGLPAQLQRRHRGRHGHVRVLPAVPDGLTGGRPAYCSGSAVTAVSVAMISVLSESSRRAHDDETAAVSCAWRAGSR